MAQPMMMLAVAGVTGAMIVAFADFSGHLVDTTRARSAADAAALAGATGGPDAAARFAASNGGTVVSWSQDGTTVTVVVRIGDAEATASATA